jgi:D-glycero-D-manno-heptose 1,7-bisphosphate phosphatase
VFLDRDGVIVDSIVLKGRPVAPFRLEEFKISEGAPEAVRKLKAAGFAVIVVTNQPDVAKGALEPAELERMHEALRQSVAVDEIRVCTHVDEDGCRCRKPRPGMLVDAARERGIDLSRSFMVGDRWRDIDAGKAAGCRTVLIGDGYCERSISADFRAADITEAARLILARG